MKKYILSSAMLTLSGIACAQSSVTIFGIIDATMQRGTGSVASRTQMGSGGQTTSRLGFRGVEDLGGGLSATFWLEGALNVDNGTGGPSNSNNQVNGTSTAPNGTQGFTFGRRSTVSLVGGWGELRAGRDFSVQYHNRYAYDPFGNSGVGASQAYLSALAGPVTLRVSNSLMYFLPPNLGGFHGEVQYYFGENASNAGATADDGNGGGARFGYRAGPLDVAVSYARTKYAQTATTGDIASTSAGARYDIGDLGLMGGYYRDSVGTIAGTVGRGPQVGAIYRVGVGEIKAQYSSYKTNQAGNPESKKISLGYVHNLSKRTSVYGTYARVRNSGGATQALNGAITAANQSSSGFDLGIRHNF